MIRSFVYWFNRMFTYLHIFTKENELRHYVFRNEEGHMLVIFNFFFFAVRSPKFYSSLAEFLRNSTLLSLSFSEILLFSR